jgi:nitrogen fixation NifU-like protein
MYSRQVIEQFQSLRHVGELPDADAYVRADNPVCGDVLQLAMVANGRIAAAKVRAHGCVAAVACASQLADMILHRPLAQLLTLRSEHVACALGGLPEASLHASQLAAEALASALKAAGK